MLEKLRAKKRHRELGKAAAINHSHIPEVKTITNEALEALSDLGYGVERMWPIHEGQSIFIVTKRPRIIIEMHPGLKSGKIKLDKEYSTKERKKLREILDDKSLSSKEIEEKMDQNGLKRFLSTEEEESILNKLEEYGFKITKKRIDKDGHWFYFNFIEPQEELTGMTIDEEENPSKTDKNKEKLARDEKVSKIIEYVGKMVKRKGKD